MPNKQNTRIETRKCPSCGNNKMFGGRSNTGLGTYSYKCTKCGFMVR